MGKNLLGGDTAGMNLLAEEPEGLNLLAEEPTYLGAIGERVQQAPQLWEGGLLEATGDLLAPADRNPVDSVVQALKPTTMESPLAKGFNAVEDLANTARVKLTRALAPEDSGVAEVGRNLLGLGAELGDEANAAIQEATPKDMNIVQEAGLSVADSTLQLAPWLLARRLGLNPATASRGAITQFGAGSGLEAYGEAKRAGAESPEALKASLLNAGAEGIFEKFGVDVLMKGGKDWFGKYLVREIGGEEATTVAQSLTEKGLYNPEKWSSPEEILHDVAVTGLAAAGGAGVIKGLDKALDVVMENREEKDYTERKALEELAKIQEDAQRALLGIPEPEDGGPMKTYDYVPPPVEEPTVEDMVVGELQRVQLREGLDVAPSEEGKVFGQLLDETVGVLDALDITTQGEKPDVGGVSPEVAARRLREWEDARVPFSMRPITFSGTDERVLGLTLEQTGELTPGTVVAVGGTEDSHPRVVYQKLVESLQAWTAKYMPNARVVLNLAQFNPETQGDAFGLHQYVETPNGLVHVITPRELPGFKYSGGDQKTAMQFMTAVTHEFGHALKLEALREGMLSKGAAVGLVAQVLNQAAKGGVDAQVLAMLEGVAPAEAGLLKDWADLRARVLSGEMLATEFMEKWVGTRKLGGSITRTDGRTRSLYSWAEERLGKSIAGATALELVESVSADVEAYLSLDEYMAEQFSRAAFTRGDLDASPLGQLFKSTLVRLRQLFRDLKTWTGLTGEKIIPAGMAFETWLEEQTQRAKGMKQPKGRFKLSRSVAAKQAALRRKLRKELEDKAKGIVGEILAMPEKKAVAPEQGKVPDEIRLGMKDQIQKVRQQLDFMAEGGMLKQDGVKYQKVEALIERGQIAEAKAMLSEILGADLNWDRDYSSLVLQRLPDKAKVKAETLRATIARGDTKAAERAMWEQFLAEHPDGFTLEEARDALERNILPLEFDLTGEQATYGSVTLQQSLGSYEGANYSSVIWKSDYVLGESSHFPNHPQYLMHSRRGDSYAGERFILELQSDVFQNGDRVEVGLNPQMREELDVAQSEASFLRDWISDFEHLQGEDLLQEWKAARRVVPLKVELPETPTPEGLQTLIAYLQGELEQQQKLVTGGKQVERGLRENVGQILDNVKALRGNWWERLIREEIAQGVEDGVSVMYFPTADTLARIEGWVTEPGETLGEYQGIYNRYKGPIAKFLMGKYRAELVDLNGVTWLKVAMRDKTNIVLNWDRDNPLQPSDPQIVLDSFAGMTEEEFRTPERVAEAAGFWERLGFKSPYWLRWGKDTKVVEPDGTPRRVWRGTGSRVSFLDPTTRGGLTGVGSAKKAFWFAEDKENAAFYAHHAVQARKVALKPEYQREGQKLREGLAAARELLAEMSPGDYRRELMEKAIRREQRKLNALLKDSEKTEPTQPLVQGFYLNIVNPLVVDMGGQEYNDKVWTKVLDDAQAMGHDGVVLKNAADPKTGTIYAIFAPEQAKLESNIGTFDPTDSLHWDRDSTVQAGTRNVAKLVQNVWEYGKLKGLEQHAKFVDGALQLQQLAAGHQEDVHLQSFVRKLRKAEGVKNRLMRGAEETVKGLISLGRNGLGDKGRAQLFKALQAEWKTGELQGTLVGLDASGEVIYGGEAEQQASLGEVQSWEVRDGVKLRTFLKTQGIDAETVQGERMVQKYLEIRNVIVGQYHQLGQALSQKAGRMYANAPALAKSELWQIHQMVYKLMASPFVPQGNFGKYVLIVQRDRGPVQFGQRRFVTFRKQHFEDKAAFDRAYLEATKLAFNDLTLKVKSQVLEESNGIPMQLPLEFLDKLGATGEFTDEQLDLMSELMTSSKYEKIEGRYKKLGEQLEGGNDDLARVFANFTWHNANFIWKLQWRSELQGSITAAKAEVRKLEGNRGVGPEEKLARLTQMRRHISAMESSLEYLMHPPFEFQNMRGWITLFYLAYNIKTAVMNLSTHFNTMATLGFEYGEKEGLASYGRAWKSFRKVNKVVDLRLAGEKVEFSKAELEAGYEVLAHTLLRAKQEGIVDQSFAYYLAGQATAGEFMKSVTTSVPGRLGHTIGEVGMLPFQTVEKFNRIITMLAFTDAEYRRGRKEKKTTPLDEVYDKAARRTDVTQNAYDAANRPKFLRGKIALATMFMSYSQFMGWVMTGGLTRAVKAEMVEEGRVPPSWWRSPTIKLWLVYLALGGGYGLPFAQNLMDLIQWLWRKISPKENLDTVLREELKGLGLDSNLALHGVMHNALGFDMSGSFGLGRLVPGTDMLNKEFKNANEFFGGLFGALGGPAGNFYKDVYEAVGHGVKGDGMESAKSFPGAIGSVSKALDAGWKQALRPTYGVVTKDGARMTQDRETGEFRDLTVGELGGMALGANPTILSENRAERYAIMGEQIFWSTRRAGLLDRYQRGVTTGDEELLQDARKAIQDYNKEIPDKALFISGKDMGKTLKSARTTARKKEAFGTDVKRYRGLARDIEESRE